MEAQQSQPKLSSRLSTLNMFGKFSSKPPRPPPKDTWYLQGKASASSVSFSTNASHSLSGHAASIASCSRDTLTVPQTPMTGTMLGASQSHYNLAIPRSMSPTPSTSASTISLSASAYSFRSVSTETTASRTSSAGAGGGGRGSGSGGNSFRRGLSKLGALSKRSFFSKGKAPAGPKQWEIDEDGRQRQFSPELEDDESISRPWNVQHHLHIDEDLSNLPPEWIESLRKKGYSDAEIMASAARRRQTYLQNHPDLTIYNKNAPPLPTLPSIAPSIASSSSASFYPSLASPTTTESNFLSPVQPLSRAGSWRRNNEYTLSVASTIRTGMTERPPPSIDEPYHYSSNYDTDGYSSPPEQAPKGRREIARASMDTERETNDDDDRESYASRPPPSLPTTPARQRGPRQFRVVNVSPMSPPPAYAPGDGGGPAVTGGGARTGPHGYSRDVKVDPSASTSQPAATAPTARSTTEPRARTPVNEPVGQSGTGLRVGLDVGMDADTELLGLDGRTPRLPIRVAEPPSRLPPQSTPETRREDETASQPAVRAPAGNCADSDDEDNQPLARFQEPQRSDSLPPVVLVDPPSEPRPKASSLSRPSTPPPHDGYEPETPPHLRTPSQTGGSAGSLSPLQPISIPRAPPRPPRLSLHQDLSSDLNSWSASLFSVLDLSDKEGDDVDVFGSKSASIAEPSGSKENVQEVVAGKSLSGAASAPLPAPEPQQPSSANAATLHRSGSVSGLSIRSKRGKRTVSPPPALAGPSKTMSEADAQALGPSTPLFDEVMNLVQAPSPVFSGAIDVSYLLESTSRPSSVYVALNESRVPKQPTPPAKLPSPLLAPTALAALDDSRASVISNPGSIKSSKSSGRDSQATISAASHGSHGSGWSDATIVRNVTATTARPAAANLVRAPSSSGARALAPPALSPSRDSSISVSDFPLPPPSPASIINTYSNSPVRSGFPALLSPTTSAPVNSTPPPPPPSSFIVRRPPRSSSLRSTNSSEEESSSEASSPMKPLSVNGSDSSHEYASAPQGVRVKSPVPAPGPQSGLRGEAETVLRSPTERAELEAEAYGGVQSWGNGETVDEKAGTAAQDAVEEEGYGSGSVLDDWLLDSPREDGQSAEGHARQDSVDVYDNDRDRPLPGNGTRKAPRDSGVEWFQPRAARNSSTRIRAGIVSSTVTRIELRSQKSLQEMHKGGTPPDCSPVRPPAPALAHSRANSAASTSSAKDEQGSIWQDVPGWMSEVLAPLQEFIDDTPDPRKLFTDMQEIAEGESGSVFVARVVRRSGYRRPLRNPITSVDGADNDSDSSITVAIKHVRVVSDGSPKMDDLRRELVLMSRIRHENILSMDTLYVDVAESTLWIEMELMERSLADVLALVEEGLVLQEKAIARLTCDILQALVHLEGLGIAHRDVRSDNLLVNNKGVLKMADFKHALQYDSASPMRKEVVGVVYWQAPEIRTGSYDTRKVDVWSTGATVWEMAESMPPFMAIDDPRRIPDRWPSLTQPEIYSRSLHDFLRLASSPPATRPSARDLLSTPFIRSAAPRSLVTQLLMQCKDIEDRIHRRQSVDSQGTILA